MTLPPFFFKSLTQSTCLVQLFHKFSVIFDVPQGYFSFKWLVNTQKKVHIVLSIWVILVVIIVSSDRGHHFWQGLEYILLTTWDDRVMSFATSILQRNVITHLHIKLVNTCVKLTFYLYLNFLANAKLMQLLKSSVIAYKSLYLVCPIKAINTVSANDSSLNFNKAHSIVLIFTKVFIFLWDS